MSPSVTPSSTLPDRPSLEHLKRQARDLLAAVRTSDPNALARVRPFFPPGTSLGLNQAQLVIAREYGFESWPKLKAHVALRAGDADLTERADRLVEMAVSGRLDAARSLLAEEPALATATLAAACATGEPEAVRRFLDNNPAALNSKIGPRSWEPLLYTCFSCLLRDNARRSRLMATARDLVDRGADPNAHWLNPRWNDYPEPCLYGATGVNDCPALAEMLLRAGADPNDGESLYHAMELPEPSCLQVLLEHGADITRNNALAHLLDREAPDWVRLALAYVQDPGSIPPVLSHGLRRGRSAEVFRLLIGSGMALDTPDRAGLTPYRLAVRLGRTDVAEMLAGAGADTTARIDTDRILGRLTQGQEVDPRELTPEIVATLDAEMPPQLHLQAECGNVAALEALLAAGANPNGLDENGQTPLLLPAMHGRLDVIRVLLRHGADPTLCDRVNEGHAVGWACWGSAHEKAAPPETYVRIVEELLDAGGTLPANAWGSPEVQAVLVRRDSAPAATE